MGLIIIHICILLKPQYYVKYHNTICKIYGSIRQNVQYNTANKPHNVIDHQVFTP